MRRAAALLLTLVLVSPVAAVLVLAGFAVGWWVVAVGALPYVFFGFLSARRQRQIRDRPRPDPAAIRAELAEIDRRSTPWIKAWTSCLLALTAVGVILLLVTAFQMR